MLCCVVSWKMYAAIATYRYCTPSTSSQLALQGGTLGAAKGEAELREKVRKNINGCGILDRAWFGLGPCLMSADGPLD